MTNTKEDDDMAKDIAEFEAGVAVRMAAFEEDVVIAGDGDHDWAVISLSGKYRFSDDDDETPCIIYSDLNSREAAEVARRRLLRDYADPQLISYPPSSRQFNAAGRVLQTLRSEGVAHDNIIALAAIIANAAGDPSQGRNPSMDEEIPF